MKTIKRVFAGIVMATLMLTSVMGVSAAESKQKEIYVADSSVGNYWINETDTKFAECPEAEAAIAEVNADKLTSLPTDVQKALEGKTLIWEVFDLDTVAGSEAYHEANCKDGHTVELGISSLTKSVSGVVVLHYDATADKWETIAVPAADVDYTNKTITVTLNTLSPVAVFADVAEGGSDGKAPQTTGTTSTWMIWVAVAFVAVGAGVVVSQKKERR